MQVNCVLFTNVNTVLNLQTNLEFTKVNRYFNIFVVNFELFQQKTQENGLFRSNSLHSEHQTVEQLICHCYAKGFSQHV